MPYRKILMPLTGRESDAHLPKVIFGIADAFGSHVAALSIKPDPTIVVRRLSRFLPVRVIEEIIDAARAAAENDVACAQGSVEAAAKAAGLSLRQPAHASLEYSFQVEEGVAADVIAREAPLSDLTVFAHPAEDGDRAMLEALELALLTSRKPLLLVPRATNAIVGTKVAIGWDGGLEAAYAVSAAMPFLKRAESIEILTVKSGGIDAERMDRLRDYLRLHGLNAVEHSINPGSEDTASALIDGAERFGAGLLVVGGYGHSRLRELVFGGVTRHVLANVTIPVFMAH